MGNSVETLVLCTYIDTLYIVTVGSLCLIYAPATYGTSAVQGFFFIYHIFCHGEVMVGLYRYKEREGKKKKGEYT